MTGARRILWTSLADERPNREYHWLSLMPDTRVTVAGGPPPSGDVDWIRREYRRPVERFTEAVALAWMRGLDSVDGRAFDWVASLELCSLVTAQAQRWARQQRVPHAVVIWANDPELMFYRLPPYSWASREGMRADLFLSFVRSGYDHCLALGLPEERCDWILPGVDTRILHPPETPVTEPVVSFISGLAPKKGLSLVIEAFEQVVLPRVPEAVLQVMGTGPDERLVRELCRRRPGSARYLGSGDVNRVAEVLRGTAVFATAPWAQRRWNEQYGIAYLEAMACGVPVVTTISGTNHEAVRPPNLRVPHDSEAFGAALLHFLTDPARRAEVGRINRARVLAEHDMLTQATRMADVFRRHEQRLKG